MLKVQGFRDLCIKLEILDAIKNSMRDLSVWQASIDAMVGFWCEETNTLVLGFGETTVTKEDAHVLGNFLIYGPLLKSLTEEMALFEGEAECGSRKDLQKKG